MQIEVNEAFIDYYNMDSELYNNKELIFLGSYGSGKSYAVADMIVLRLFHEPRRLAMVVRQEYNTLKDSCYSVLIKSLDKFKIKYTAKTSPLEINLKNGSRIIFRGADDPEKIKSIDNASLVWIEEATAVHEEMYHELKGRLRSTDYKNYLFLSTNPGFKENWVYQHFYDKGQLEDVTYHKSTVIDNAFINEDYINTLKSFEFSNPYRYRVGYLCEWAGQSESTIIPLEKFRACKGKVLSGYDNILLAGLDVSGVGADDTVMFVDNGRYINQEFVLSGRIELSDITDKIIEWVQSNKEPMKYLCIDSTGMGQFLVDRLKELQDEDYYNGTELLYNLEIIPVNFASTNCFDTKNYLNVASELWFYGAEQVTKGTVAVADFDEYKKLEEELTSREMLEANNGKLRVQKKADCKKKINRSPDKADAFLLCVYARNWI